MTKATAAKSTVRRTYRSFLIYRDVSYNPVPSRYRYLVYRDGKLQGDAPTVREAKALVDTLVNQA